VSLRFLAGALLFLAAPALAAPPAAELRWGADAEGGAPFVEADPADPSRVRGFDVEIAGEVARRLGRTARFVQVAFTSIDASVARGDFEIGLGGVEETPARKAAYAVTVPYYEFREVLTVRAADRNRWASLAALRGRRVGTLAGTIAWEILAAAGPGEGIVPVSYDDDVHPYEDLANGRLDAVLLDHVIAARAMGRVPGLALSAPAVATGHYVGVLARDRAALRDEVDGALRGMMADGSLERIFRRWGVWEESQRRHFASVSVLAGAPQGAGAGSVAGGGPGPADVVRYLPSFCRAAAVTLVLSCLAMGLAVGVGGAVAVGRIYGTPWFRRSLAAWVELTRGTPVLLQLFVLYYGLASFVRLDAFVAALLGLGLNYAAYESEIWRGALEGVSAGQLESARALGLTEVQVLRLVRGPQALRIALAPMTNDFVALLKDSSLVSVITVVELTKQTAILASNAGSWVVPGLLSAAMYLAMSLPLARLARKLEGRWARRTG
jgi:polar amino acid transport system substrate-binding protein